MDMYTAGTHAHTGVLRELSVNVPVIPIQGFDVGRGRRKEFRAHKSQVMRKVKMTEKAFLLDLQMVKAENEGHSAQF